jgi:hypothetical protein
MARAEKERLTKSLAPQGQRAHKIVEMVLYQSDRVPTYKEVNSSEDYANLSKYELLKKLEMKDKELAQLGREKASTAQTAVTREDEWKKCLKEQETKNKQLEEMRRQLQKVSSSNNELHSRLLKAHKQGYENGKQEVSKFIEQIFSEAQVTALLTKKKSCLEHRRYCQCSVIACLQPESIPVCKRENEDSITIRVNIKEMGSKNKNWTRLTRGSLKSFGESFRYPETRRTSSVF